MAALLGTSFRHEPEPCRGGVPLMKPSELVQVLKILVPQKMPVLIQGPPGVGKTAIADLVCTELRYDLIISHPVVDEPVDYKGMPHVSATTESNPTASWIPYGQVRQLIEAKKPTIWLIDDLGQAPLSVQAALMQWIHRDSRTLNGQRLSEHVSIVACTNRREDRAGVSGFLEPVKSRFASILQLDVDHHEWTDWATGRLPPELIAFIGFRPELLSKPVPSGDLKQSPSPRGWESVGLLHRHIAALPSNLRLEIITGAVGEAAASEYAGFLQVFHELPEFDDIVARPKKAEVPVHAHTLYALCGMLAMDATAKNMGAIITYAERMPEEFQYLLVRFIARLNAEATETAAYIRWATSHQEGLH